jgi:small subunit ribosomal protein S1
MAEQDEDFAAMFERSLQSADGTVPRPRQKRLAKGESVKATVVAIGEDAVFVDVGTKSEGQIDRHQLLDADGNLRVKVGDVIRATVADPGHRGAPRLVVSIRGGDVDAATLQVAADAGTPVEGTFSKAVKAGLEVDIAGLRAFCPASLVDITYVGDLETFVGQRHFFRVLEVRDNGRSVVVSRRALLEAERAEQAKDLRARLAVGQQLDGIVQSVQSYGAFIDLGGLQGLLHVSEMSRGHVGAASDMVSAGDHVRVEIKSIEPGKSPDDVRISLSMKALEPPAGPDPSAQEVITATIAKVEGHGLLVDTPVGAGLVPTSELALPPGADPRRMYSEGDSIAVVMLRRDPKGRARFSAKQVEEVQARKDFASFREGSGRGSKSLGSFGDLLRDKLAGVDVADGPKTAGKPDAPAKATASTEASPPGRPKQRKHIK